MRNTHILSISLIFISVAFVIVSILVTFTGGKNKYLIAKKLRLGAIIIGMTCVANGCMIHSSCYAVPRDSLYRKTENTFQRIEKIVVELNGNDQSQEFKCNIKNNENISFHISLENEVVLSGNCKHEISLSSTELHVKTRKVLEPGNYVLKLYSVKEADIKDDTYMYYSVDLKVNEIDK